MFASAIVEVCLGVVVMCGTTKSYFCKSNGTQVRYVLVKREKVCDVECTQRLLSSVKLPGKHVGDVIVTWQMSTIVKKHRTLIATVRHTLFGGREGAKEKGREEREMRRRAAEKGGGEERERGEKEG